MTPRVFTTGGVIIDNVVSHDGALVRGQIGGNAIYSAAGARLWLDPVGVLEPALRKACPPGLDAALKGLSAGISPWLEERLRIPGHCLGNLLMTASVFRPVRQPGQAPSAEEMTQGLERVADVIGVPPGQVMAATASPNSGRRCSPIARR